MTTIVVADDHPVVRGGIVALLAAEPDLEVVGEVGDGDALVALALEMHPDVVLTDLRMPGCSGVEAARRILEALPETRILVLTTYESDADILAAIEGGAMGYLLKAAPSEDIVAGVRAVARGETALAPALAATLARGLRQPSRPALSPRELEVLALLRRGSSNPEIARALFIGETTVKSHVQHIFEKLGVSDRTSAVATAIDEELI